MLHVPFSRTFLSPPDSQTFPSLLLTANYEAVSSFSDYAAWLIPGALMQGRYPYIEPSRCLTREEGEEHLTEILQAGLTTFVSLQEEIAPQVKMPIGGQNGFYPYKAAADIIASGIYGPPPFEEIAKLRNRDLDKFLPPRRKPKTYTDNRPELEFLHFPITDLGVPSRAELEKMVDALAQKIEAGGKVYLHCWGGRGRSGLVAACLLARLYGLTEDEALARVQRAYSTRLDPERTKSPETPEQFAMVKEYIRELLGAKSLQL